MTVLIKLISYVGLALTVVPAFLVFTGRITWQTHATLMLVGTVMWFATAPLWMGQSKPRLWVWKRRRPI